MITVIISIIATIIENRDGTTLGKVITNAITAVIALAWLTLLCSLEEATALHLIALIITSGYLGLYCIMNGGQEEW